MKTMKTMKITAMFIAMLACVGAAASDLPETSVEPSTTVSASGAVAGSRASADAYSNAAASGTGQGTGIGGGADVDASNGVDIETSVEYPRQVPPVLLPTLLVSKCGAGASAGGSGTSGAGALSGIWTSKRCYALQAAVIAFGVGDYEGGCQRLAFVTREADEAIGYKPACKAFAAKLEAEAKRVGDLQGHRQETSCRGASGGVKLGSSCVTKEELDRAFRASAGSK